MSGLAVGLVGVGGIYRLAHGPAWRQMRRARVVAVCDTVEERAEQARRELEADAAYTQLEDLLAHDGIDLIDLCTPSDTHADMSIRALGAGKHVLCEKPMALTPDDCARMIRAASDAKRHLYVGHTRRFDGRWTLMKEQIVAGRIGEPVAVRRAERSWGGAPAGAWQWDVGRSGGALMDLGVHVADLFAWFFDAEPAEVYAKALTVREEARASGCFDFAVVQVGFAEGKRGIMEVSWAHPKGYAPYYSTTEVIGTRGKLLLSDKDAGPMTIIKDGISVPRYSPLLSTFPEVFQAELNHFLDCIEGKAQPQGTPEQALTAVRVIAAAFESIASGQPVPLSPASGDAVRRRAV